MKTLLSIMVLLAAPTVSVKATETSTYPTVFSMQERAGLRDQWLKTRLDTLVPALMRERGIDMWLVLAREYNDDPVLTTMLPSDWMSARRQTILVFYDDGQNVERLAVSRYAVGEVFKAAWDPEAEPDQWKRLADIIAERDPKKIAVNVSDTFALADGLTHSQHQRLVKTLGQKWQSRLTFDPALAIGWLERRTPAEMEYYPHIVGLAHAIIYEGLSSKTITPGTTTVTDLVWWFRDTIRAHGVTTWFHPSIAIQRHNPAQSDTGMLTLFDTDSADVIQPGDLIHLDFGITYMGLNSDTQHHAYVLRPGEKDAPTGLKNALAVGNRLQDILTSNFKTGMGGNAVLAKTRAAAIAEGIKPWVYTHPIGFHGHGAGATIGMWDQQDGVKSGGDYPINANAAWSIELSALVTIPEWEDQEIRIMLEEDAFFDGENVRYIDGRQTRFHLIK